MSFVDFALAVALPLGGSIALYITVRRKANRRTRQPKFVRKRKNSFE